MKSHGKSVKLPRYQGSKWIEAELPRQGQPWLLGKHKSIRKERQLRGAVEKELRRVIEDDAWQWPKRTLYFFSDLHADTDAFIASLVASGGFRKTGPGDADFKLTKA
ncbi:MAG: hypothetical protein U9P11_03590, partial [Pseudomonadota bacterium]|nr:hypothetical protein [Pseudomonadota bacterium]